MFCIIEIEGHRTVANLSTIEVGSYLGTKDYSPVLPDVLKVNENCDIDVMIVADHEEDDLAEIKCWWGCRCMMEA